MIRALPFVLLFAACTPAPTELPEDFDPSFVYFIAPD